ncbi:tetratricopeptide repeat protein [Nocardia sp. NPDC004604]|uniref:tetratricopeptide repeat protein n=1 Tax=Nocardia sp. NPDC004604 TaxID=3157013 RepID=UPI0033BC63B2
MDYFKELAELYAAAGSPGSEEVATWIQANKNYRVPVSTIGDWLKPNPVVPRQNGRLALVLECLHVRASKRWSKEVLEQWKKLRAAAWGSARADDTMDTASTAAPAAVDKESTSVMVGLIPQEPRHFVHRQQIDDLETGLVEAQVAVVVGMRGAGKTHIAAAYARRLFDRGGGLVGWVSAETADTLHSGLAEIANLLRIATDDGDTVRSAHRLRDHLNNSTEQRLLVFDNASDVDLVRTLLPIRGGTRVVVTSTNLSMAYLAGTVIDTGTGYTNEQAVTYLRTATGIIDDPDGELELAKELGFLPLALSAAASAITFPRPRLTYQGYLFRLRHQPLPRVLQRREEHDYYLSVDQAILLSVADAEAPTGDSELETVVVWLLGLFATLSAAGVSRSLINYPDPDLNELVDDAIDRCVRRSLLSWSTGEGTLLAHRLTARILRERARDARTESVLLLDALQLLDRRLFPEQQASNHRIDGSHLVDQIDAIWDSGLHRSADMDLCGVLLRMRRWATRQLIAAGDVNRAINTARPTLVDHLAILGDNNHDTLMARNNLAFSFESAGRLREAIPLYEENLDEHKRVLGVDHPDTLISRNNLAGAYKSAGQWNQALSLFKENLAEGERVFGPDHPGNLLRRNRFAITYGSMGRWDQALPLLEQNLADYEHVFGAEHSETLDARNSLGGAFLSLGRWNDAVLLFERNFELRVQVLGADHPETLMSQNNLAEAYRSAGRSDEAIPLLEHTLAQNENILGADHPNTLQSRHNVAAAYQSWGRLDEAIPLLEHVLAENERVLGADHPNTLLSRHNVTYSYASIGRLDEASISFEQSLAEYHRVLGVDHPDTLKTMTSMANAYRMAGRSDKAFSLLEQCLAIHERVFSVDRADTMQLRNNLAYLYQSAGQFDAAIPHYERNLLLCEQVLGANHVHTLMARNDLASAYYSAGRPDDAIPLFERCVAEYDRVLGADHPETLVPRQNLAVAYCSTGQVREAIPLFEKNLAGFERLHGTDHVIAQKLR